MRIESSFFEKSSSRFILERSRGLGILTFDRIKKIVFLAQNQQIKTKTIKNSSFCQKFILLKNTYKKIYYGSIYRQFYFTYPINNQKVLLPSLAESEAELSCGNFVPFVLTQGRYPLHIFEWLSATQNSPFSLTEIGAEKRI